MQTSRLLFSALVILIIQNSFAKNDITQVVSSAAPDSCMLLSMPESLKRFAVRDFAISPDKNELFFTIESNKNTFTSIIRMSKMKGKWITALAPFSGQYSDLEPAYSQDGNTLYFASNRPLKEGDKIKDYDIWRSLKVNGSWSAPENIGEPVNTTANEFYPSVARSGNLYFTAAYKDAKGKEDIYVSRFIDGKYNVPESLPDSVNSALYEFNAFVAPDESYLIFTSFGRPDDLGGGDMYISKKNREGAWQKAQPLGKAINSVSLDYCPYISPDQKSFVFTSDRTRIKKSYTQKLDLEKFLETIGQEQNGKGNLYWISADAVLK